MRLVERNVKDAARAFIELDVELAHQVIEAVRLIDMMESREAAIMDNHALCREWLIVISASRNIERLADMASIANGSRPATPAKGTGHMEKGEICILVIEDESDIRTLLLHQLRKDGYIASGAANGEDGLKSISGHCPQLIVLDLMLPGMDGMAVCRKVRNNPDTRSIPILMLTARSEEEDMVSGLEAGADDYVAKPFSNRVLLARVRSLLRRSGVLGEDGGDSKTLTVGEIRLAPEMREVTVHGEQVDLTAGEYKMLKVLMRRPGVVFTRNQLLDLVHGQFRAVTDRAVDVQVAGLRKKLGSAGARVETVRGAGYRISPR
ncbi:MAG: response regulator [Planctomycetota bacterium]|jgi:two-component system phosphate regulon response regulator PhoB|nr:response regulator [Planctomycetota bacterium]